MDSHVACVAGQWRGPAAEGSSQLPWPTGHGRGRPRSADLRRDVRDRASSPTSPDQASATASADATARGSLAVPLRARPCVCFVVHRFAVNPRGRARIDLPRQAGPSVPISTARATCNRLGKTSQHQIPVHERKPVLLQIPVGAVRLCRVKARDGRRHLELIVELGQQHRVRRRDDRA